VVHGSGRVLVGAAEAGGDVACPRRCDWHLRTPGSVRGGEQDRAALWDTMVGRDAVRMASPCPDGLGIVRLDDRSIELMLPHERLRQGLLESFCGSSLRTRNPRRLVIIELVAYHSKEEAEY
jgi:hypothetical protein